MRNLIYILLLLLASLGVETAKAQQFQPLFLIEWADSNGMIPVTTNFMGFDGVQAYAKLDTTVQGIVNRMNISTQVCNDTITQVGHGFSVGDLIGNVNGTTEYFLANTNGADSIPVAAVFQVVDNDNFIPCNEGFFTYTHGLLNNYDYFLQDDGSLDTIPDSTYQVFAFRTFNTNLAYFDIPELVITGGGGVGTVEDADWYDVSTGAPPVSMGQNIYTTGQVGIGRTTTERELHITGSILFQDYTISRGRIMSKTNLGIGLSPSGSDTELIKLSPLGGGNYVVDLIAPGTSSKIRVFGENDIQFQNAQGRVEWKENGSNAIFTHVNQNASDQLNIFGHRGVILDGGSPSGAPLSGMLLIIDGPPNYASDAAADADSNLPTNAIYTVTAEDRTLRIKP